MSGGTAEALKTLTSELIASHTRCHYPYLLTSGPCSLQGPGGARAGVFITVVSEVFGRIASASEPTWEAALLRICRELDRTRDARWVREGRWASSAAGQVCEAGRRERESGEGEVAMVDEPPPHMLTVGRLKEILGVVPDETVVALSVPPSFPVDPRLTLLLNVRASYAGGPVLSLHHVDGPVR